MVVEAEVVLPGASSDTLKPLHSWGHAPRFLPWDHMKMSREWVMSIGLAYVTK